MTNKMSKTHSQNKEPAALELHHLPRQLTCLMQSPERNRISSMVVTKSWGSVSKECGTSSFIKTLPLVQIQLSININNTKTYQIVQVPSSQYQMMSRRRNQFDRSHRLKFMGDSEGSLVWNNGSTHFTDPKSGINAACVAYFDHVNHFNPTACVNVVLTGISSPNIIIRHRPKSWINCDTSKLKWLKYGCNLVDPNDSRQGYLKFCTGIWFGDMFYALTLQGTLVVLQFELDHSPLITAIGSGRAVPSSTSRHFREYLLEANGQILVVFLLSKKSVKVVDDVEVFGLDTSNLKWVKMRRLGESTGLLLGLYWCVAISGRNLSSCICFCNVEFDGWKVYDMVTGCIRDGLDSYEP